MRLPRWRASRRSRCTSTACPSARATTSARRDGALLFDRPLAKEGRLGLWRWFLGAWGIGTYRQHDSVDVAYEYDGRRYVAEALDIEPPERD